MAVLFGNSNETTISYKCNLRFPAVTICQTLLSYRRGYTIYTMSEQDATGLDPDTLKRIQDRVLKAEKSKLHMKVPRGINNEIEEIIEQEVTEDDIPTNVDA